MFQNYCERLQDYLIKEYKAEKKTDTKKISGKAVKKSVKKSVNKSSIKSSEPYEYDELMKSINGFIPESFYMSRLDFRDNTGLLSDKADFLAAEKIFKASEQIFSEGLPLEVVRGSFNVCRQINHKQLLDVLVKTAESKKIGSYSAKKKQPFIVSTILSFDSIYSMEEIKKEITAIYKENSVDPRFEFDLFVVFGKGILIKDWSKKSTFIALDTETDTLMWFFIMLNEFFSAIQKDELDLRSYISNPKRYNEY
jgi:hypothetical protein